MAVPRVTAVHDLSFFARPEEFAWLDGMKRRWLVSASVRASAAVLACSEFTRREIAGRFPGAADRVRHVPLGPDDALAPPPERETARRRLGVSGPLLLAVGTLFHRRCLPELLRAIALLRRHFPDLRLEVVGENRTYPHRGFDALIEGLELRDAVRMSGFVDEGGLADRYAAADAVVALSLYEGFGLPALEAMARGVPLVAANRPSLDEVVAEGGVLVDPLDPNAIAGAIARILASAAMRDDLRERGRRRAQRFSWAVTARLTRSALAEAAAK
jgi:glycosyltransferase involved in cell wall biosynthesis